MQTTGASRTALTGADYDCESAPCTGLSVALLSAAGIACASIFAFEEIPYRSSLDGVNNRNTECRVTETSPARLLEPTSSCFSLSLLSKQISNEAVHIPLRCAERPKLLALFQLVT